VRLQFLYLACDCGKNVKAFFSFDFPFFLIIFAIDFISPDSNIFPKTPEPKADPEARERKRNRTNNEEDER
jgi:hypothetical protein